ncbi:MAG: ribosomal protein S18-alanine N-acetyltransferase [Paracoccaceae bacterium]
MPDAVALAALHAACFTLPRPWTASEITALRDSPHVFMIRESGGFLMGRAVAGEAELLTLAVSPDLRRLGMGRRLVHTFQTEAAARGATSAFLEVAASNFPAVALYERAGFTPVGRRKGYYKGQNGAQDDAVIMSCTL